MLRSCLAQLRPIVEASKALPRLGHHSSNPAFRNGTQVCFMSQQKSLYDDNSEALISLSKIITSSISSYSEEEQLLSRFNITRDVFEHFKNVSNGNFESEEGKSSLSILKNILDAKTMGILEEVFSGSQSFQEFSTVIKCHGCGAILQCEDRLKPGFISSQLMQQDVRTLRETKCKRCSTIEAYDIALATTIKPTQFKEMVANQIKSNKNSALLAMVDLTDFTNRTLPNLLEGTIHKHSQIILIGNKFDLIPPDDVGYDERLLDMLKTSSEFLKEQVKKIHLVSAKTGFGVEEVITSIHKLWSSRRDVYLIGAVNVGKSSLFNILLQSDLGKGRTMDVFQKATVSKWPGTTLNTLKFPLEEYSTGQLQARQAMLYEKKRSKERDMMEEYAADTVHRSMLTGLNQLRTDDGFKSPFEINEDAPKSLRLRKDQRWFYDTPGILNDESILPLLNQNELQQVIPAKPYVPRIYSLTPNHALTFAGLGRIEYTKGVGNVILFVFSTPSLPVVIANIDETRKNFPLWLQSGKLQVPSTLERHEELGSFASSEHSWVAQENNHVCSDILFASTGWATLMLPRLFQEVELKISCLYSQPILRASLLTNVYRLMGKRVPRTPKYEVRKDYSKLFVQGKSLFRKHRVRFRKPPAIREFKSLFDQ